MPALVGVGRNTITAAVEIKEAKIPKPKKHTRQADVCSNS